MYDKMKFVIEKLTAKIKYNHSLSQAELVIFEQYVHEIIDEAKMYESQKAARVNESSAFEELKGLGNTWNIDGMESMTTEEYYAALNKRNSQINEQRRSQNERFGPQQMNSFLQGLSRR